MQQIGQGNPKYQEALLENYGKNLQQSVAQEQNKMIGRIGVQLVNLAMTEEERKKHLQQLGDASAIWQALKEVLDEATEICVCIPNFNCSLPSPCWHTACDFNFFHMEVNSSIFKDLISINLRLARIKKMPIGIMNGGSA